MTTVGELISTLFTKFERQYHDPELAAIATQVAMDELLQERARVQRRRAA
jgi:hypothetical protein